ncbi:hypothetical protein GE09DRAFT_1155068 [Coniochaeta sp. 2T2.1]|nr:hypothetical protein GE09DRAFT_1155068 [Coniochaeta sp. 2T2.1]
MCSPKRLWTKRSTFANTTWLFLSVTIKTSSSMCSQTLLAARWSMTYARKKSGYFLALFQTVRQFFWTSSS